MAEEVVATFSGPLDSFSTNLTLDNASNSDVQEFGISGRTAKFPVTWGSFGVLAGPVTATATDGVDTEVVMVHLSIVSYNFSQGEAPKLESVTTCTPSTTVVTRRARGVEKKPQGPQLQKTAFSPHRK